MSIEPVIINKVISNIEKHNLINPGDTVVIGVSGGADSVMLLDVMYKISILAKYNLNIKVAHVNHQIRDTAIRDELFVKSMCEKMSIPYFCKSVDVEKFGKENGMSCEEAGRKIRYDFFRELAGENGKIATAHNANDNVETLLMRLFRGTGLKGLCGIAYKNDNIVRPILNIARKDIEQYIKDCHLTHITDETNLVPIYTRNKVRLNVIPMIEKEFNSNFCNTVTSSIENFNEDMDFINSMAQKSYEEICSEHDGVVSIDSEKFLILHNAMKSRVIAMAIEKVKGNAVNISSTNIDDVIALFDKNNNSSVDIGNNIVAIRRYGIVDIQAKIIKENTEVKDIRVSEHIGDIIEVNGEFVKIRIVDKEFVTNTEFKMYVPAEEVNNLVFRRRQDGDHYRKQKSMTCSLKKHLSNMKMKTEKRNEMMFLYNKNCAIWIMNYSAMRLENRSGKFVEFEIV